MPNRSRSSSRDRLLRLSRLRRASFSRPIEVASSPNPRRKRRRFAWILTPLVFLALLLVAGNFYVRQNFDVERIVRQQIVPQIERQLNAKVEIGRVESDYISRVTLHDIVIGRNAKLPLGALAQIKSATLQLDLPSLILHRTDALGALRSVDLQSPRVVIKRDAKGQLNWAKLWKPLPHKASSQWRGVLTAQNGRVWFQDATILSSRGVPLVADAQNVRAKIVANGAAPATFSLQVVQAFIGHKPQQTALQNLSFDGRAEPKLRWVFLRAKVPQLPLALPIEYSNGVLPIRANGEIGATIQIAYDSTAPKTERVLVGGNGVARNVNIAVTNTKKLPLAIIALQTRLSRVGETLSARKINGAFRFDNRAFSTNAMMLQTLGGAWQIAGNVAAPANSPVSFDVSALTKNADITRLAPMFAPVGTTLRGGISSARLRISGDAKRAQIGGDVTIPNASLQNALGKVQSDSLHAVFSTDTQAQNGNARFSLRNAQGQTKSDSARFRVLDGNAIWSRKLNTTQLNVELRAPDYTLRRAQFGALSGRELKARVAAFLLQDGGRWRGQGNGVFSSLGLSAQGFSGNKTSQLRAKSATATLDFDGESLNHNASLRFDLNGANVRDSGFGEGAASSARGLLWWKNADNKTPLSADISFADLQMRPSRALWKTLTKRDVNTTSQVRSQLRARDFRVLVSTQNARDNASSWNGVSSFAGVDARRLQVADFAPEISRRVRNLGVLNGRAQWVFNPKNPAQSRLEGDFGLSRAQIDDFDLRAISSRVFYEKGVVRLANGRAQSSEGALLLDAVYDTKNASGNVGLSATQVRVESARVNPFLRALGLQWQGAARGQVRVASRLRGGKMGAMQTRFDLRAPQMRLANRVLDEENAAVLSAGETRLVGNGVFQNGVSGVWKFVGRAQMRTQNAQLESDNSSSSASLKLGNFRLPASLRGVQISGLRLITQGEIAKVGIGNANVQPKISGTLSFARVTLRLPNRGDNSRSLTSPTFVLQNAQMAFNADSSRLQIARWQAQAPQFQAPLQQTSTRGAMPILSGYLNLGGDVLNGQFLLRDVDASRAQNLADRFFPTLRQSQTALRGVVFARVALAGTLRSPRAQVQTRLYRGAISSAGIVVPIDAARLEIALAPQMSAFAIRDLVLWSRGGRLAASGTVASRNLKSIEYSNVFDLNLSLQLSNWRVRDLEKLAPKTPQISSFDGALSGDLQLTGTTNAPHLAGKTSLKLAHWNGVDIPQATAEIDAEQTPRGLRLVLANINGRAADATIEGEANFDQPQKVWSARLVVTDLAAQRAVRLLETFAPQSLQIAPQTQSSTRKPTPKPRAPFETYSAVNASASDAASSGNEQFEARNLDSIRPNRKIAQPVGNTNDANANDANRGRIALSGDLRAVISVSGTLGDSPAKTSAAKINVANDNATAKNGAHKTESATTENTATKNAANADFAIAKSSSQTNDESMNVGATSGGATNAKNLAATSANAKIATIDNAEDTNLKAARSKEIEPKVASTKVASIKNSAMKMSRAAWFPVLREADVTLLSDGLSWRGRDLGALTSSLSLRDGVVRINDFSLLRRLSAREIAINARAQKNAGTDGLTGDATTEIADNLSDEMAQIRVVGTLPLDVNDARAVPFDTTVTVENERFTVLREALRELDRVLSARGIRPANLEVLLRRVDALPPDLEGRLNAKTQLSGRWGALSVALDANVDNARTSTQTLPALQTSLVFSDGAIDVNAFEIKQTFEENADGELSPASGLAIDENSDDSQRVRETALRVAPGGRIVPDGEISLDVEVLKANLAQLSGWLPELRPTDGKALLRGELSLFSFEVRGQTSSPEVTGSVEARDLSYRTYTLDRLRIAQFSIRDGMLSVEPGKLTVVKGGFQSSAAYGSVPWSWGENGAAPGPRRDGTLDVHLPLQTRDFGALAGALIPALTNVAADGFSGSVDVTGTLDKPQLAGEIKLQNARFRADPVSGPFAFGVEKLNGDVRFADGNRVLVDSLSGQLARAQAVTGTRTGNRSAAERKADLPTETPIRTNTNVALRAISQAIPTTETSLVSERPDVSGRFTLNGDVALSLGSDSSDQDPSRAASRLAFHRYNLDLILRDGAFRTENLSGLREISLDATWKTGDGAAQNAQNLTWKLNAKGRAGLSAKAEKKSSGALSSQANVRLSPDFATGLNAILHSRFDGAVQLKSLGWEMRNVGRGVLDGDLKLDNSTARENAGVVVPRKHTPPKPTAKNAITKPVGAPAAEAQNAKTLVASSANKKTVVEKTDAITRSSASMSDMINGVARGANAFDADAFDADAFDADAFGADAFGADAFDADAFGANAYSSTRNDDESAISGVENTSPLRAMQDFQSETVAPSSGGLVPLRISGALVLSQTEVSGLPAAGAGGADFVLPAPNFDIRLSTGKNVRFTTPTVRAELEGTLSIAGTPRDPRIVGVVSTRNGQVRFPNASARIQDGTVEIEVVRDNATRQLRPRATIDATARGQVGRYAISIAMRGPLDLGSADAQNLRVDVTSNPPLSQDEAFAQLTGTSLRDIDSGNPLTGNAANQAYARAVVGLLSAPLFSGLERTLEQTLGLNSLTLDYRLNEPLNIVVGKAIGDRVFVTYRRSLARGTLDKPASSVRVDVRITGGVQVGAESDDTGRRRITIEKTFRF